MDTRLVSALSAVYRATPRNVFLVAVTGGGAHSVTWLLSVPGASHSLMEAVVPYSRSSLDTFLSLSSSQSRGCSAETACVMARAARQRATQLLLNETRNFGVLKSANLFGVSCTGALVSDQPKKGDHRCHVAISGRSSTRVYSLTMNKGARNREEEDTLSSLLVADAVAFGGKQQIGEDACEFTASRCTTKDVLVKDTIANEDVVNNILSRKTKHALVLLSPPTTSPSSDSTSTTTSTSASTETKSDLVWLEDVSVPPRSLIVPMAFTRPLDEKQVRFIHSVLKWQPTDTPVVLELAIHSSHAAQVDTRCRELLSSQWLLDLPNVSVCLTLEPLLLNKSDLFRNCSFALRQSTFSRFLLQPLALPYSFAFRYALDQPEPPTTTGNVAQLAEILAVIADRGCRFLITEGSSETETLIKQHGDMFPRLKQLVSQVEPSKL